MDKKHKNVKMLKLSKNKKHKNIKIYQKINLYFNFLFFLIFNFKIRKGVGDRDR